MAKSRDRMGIERPMLCIAINIRGVEREWTSGATNWRVSARTAESKLCADVLITSRFYSVCGFRRSINLNALPPRFIVLRSWHSVHPQDTKAGLRSLPIQLFSYSRAKFMSLALFNSRIPLDRYLCCLVEWTVIVFCYPEFLTQFNRLIFFPRYLISWISISFFFNPISFIFCTKFYQSFTLAKTKKLFSNFYENKFQEKYSWSLFLFIKCVTVDWFWY